MKEQNIIQEKSFPFSLRILKLFQHLLEKKGERDLCTQLLRSGTSTGANVEEAIGGSFRKDIIHKLEISCREARKTKYWLQLLKEGELLEEKLASSFLTDCEKMLKILSAIINSSKDKNS